MKQIVSAFALGVALWACGHFAPPAQAQVNVDIVVSVAPPAVIVEPPPPPRVGFVWAPGFWQWNGYRHVWQAGHWEAEQAGESYVASQWVEASGGWRFVPAHWKRDKHFKHHDDDGDDDYDDDHHHDHFCPPGQAKKGRC